MREARTGDALAFDMLYAKDDCLGAFNESEDSDYNLNEEIEAKLEAEPRCPCCAIDFGPSVRNAVDGSYSTAAYDAVIEIHARAWFSRT